MGDMGDMFREMRAEKRAERDRTPTFAEAAAYVIHFGKFKGKSVDTIAMTDDGLRYLDWLRGELGPQAMPRKYIAAYLDDPTIAADLAKLVRRA